MSPARTVSCPGGHFELSLERRADYELQLRGGGLSPLQGNLLEQEEEEEEEEEGGGGEEGKEKEEEVRIPSSPCLFMTLSHTQLALVRPGQ